MPIYEYRCKQGHNFEVIQSMSDDPVTSCTVCGAAVDRVFHPVAVHFKGSGFYTTDYGRKRGGGGGADSDGSKSDSKETTSSQSESKSESKSSDSKSESKSESKSDSKSGSSGD